MKPIYDERVLGDPSDAGARASAEPPAANAAHARLVASLADLGAEPVLRRGDDAKRAVLARFAAKVADLPR